MDHFYSLKHSDALEIINTVKLELEKKNKGAAIAVVDSHGELIAFLKTDGCKLPSIEIAINKAYTAARERRESKMVGNASKEEGFPMTNFGSLKYVSWGGGVPIVYKDQVIGAIGISGLPEEEDMKLARLGAGLIN